MHPSTAAFLCGAALPSRARASPRVQQRRPPTSLSAGAAAAELLLSAAVLGSAAWVLVVAPARERAKADAARAAVEAARPPVDMMRPTGGVIGLRGYGSGAATTFAPSAGAVAAPVIVSTAPVGAAEFHPLAELPAQGLVKPVGWLSARLREELQWASGQVVQDLGADGFAVFAADGALVWCDGAMAPVPAATPGVARRGGIVERVARTRIAEDYTGSAATDIDLPFFAGMLPIKSLAIIPVPEAVGAVMVLASCASTFYGPIQERIAVSVANRLGMYLFTDSFKQISSS
jgi:hypothetical protein